MNRIFPPTRSGLNLGFGGAPVGNMYSAISDADADDLLHAVHSGGCVMFDTAPHYGNGRSEQRFGRFLKSAPRHTVVISSKVGRILTPDIRAPRDFGAYVDILPNVQHFDYSGPGVRRSIEDSLQRLGLSYIDVAYVHDCSVMTHGERAPAILNQVVTETIPALHRLRSEGLIRYIGIAVSHWQTCVAVLHATELDCLLLAGRYTLLDQSALEVLLPLCVARRIRIALGGPFNSGILATGTAHRGGPPRFNYEPAPAEYVARAAAIERVCQRHEVPLRAAALQFPLAHPAIETVLVGVKSVGHWRDAEEKMRFPIPQEFWQDLRRESLLPDTASTPETAAVAAH